MRNSIRQFSGSLLAASPSVRCTASAQSTAPAALSKTASTESPAMSTTRPRWASTSRRKTVRALSSEATVPHSSEPIRRE